MSELIKKLESEHVEMLDKLTSYRKKKIKNGKVRRRFVSFMKALRAHIRKEDKEIFPVLHKAAQHNARIKKVLKISKSTLVNVTLLSRYMVDKYRHKDICIGFEEDINRLLKLFKKRVQIEEKFIFVEYLKVAR